MHFPTLGGFGNDFRYNNYLNAGQSAGEGWGWAWQILPFIEQQNTSNLRPTLLALVRFEEIEIPGYTCPSRGTRSWALQSSPGDLTICGDYAAVSFGSGWGAVPTGFNSTRDVDPSNPSIFTGAIGLGVQSADDRGRAPHSKVPKVTFGAISDGSSNTMLFGEKSAFAQIYSGVARSGISNIGDEQGMFGQPKKATNMVRWMGVSPLADNEITNRRQQSLDQSQWFDQNERDFGSPHPGTFGASLADGSMHSVSMDVDQVTYWSLGIRNDGFVLDHDSL